MSPDQSALHQRIEELEDLVAALRAGTVDALVVETEDGTAVRTVDGSDMIHHYQRLVDRLPEGIVALSPNGRILFASKRFGALVDLPSKQLVGRLFTELVAPADRDIVSAALGDRAVDDAHELIKLGVDATRVTAVLLTIERIEQPGQAAHWVIASDINHQTHLRYIAEHDHLTGLLNRRGFDAELEKHCRSAATDGAVVLIDIDRFKAVNDSWGHATGDRLLAQVAHGLLAGLRGDDVIARFGGDEFAILMRSGGFDAVNVAASRLLACIRNLELGEVLQLGRSVTVSVGAAMFTCGQDAVQAADNALYEAKRAGRDNAIVVRDNPGRRSVITCDVPHGS